MTQNQTLQDNKVKLLKVQVQETVLLPLCELFTPQISHLRGESWVHF